MLLYVGIKPEVTTGVKTLLRIIFEIREKYRCEGSWKQKKCRAQWKKLHNVFHIRTVYVTILNVRPSIKGG